MPSSVRDLSYLAVSESFYRLMQTDPTDDKTLLDGTGSVVTTLAISGTIETYNIDVDGTGSFNGITTFGGSLIIPTGSTGTSSPVVGSIMTSGSSIYIYV